jgi:hypothetical protein
MNTFFKKTAISLVVASMTTFAYAGMSNQSQMGGFYIGVEGLDLRPMNGDLDYYTVFSTNHSNTHSISTDYDWGWRLYGGIIFGDNDDFSLSWTRFRSDSSDSANLFGTSNDIKFWGGSFNSASAKVNFDVDDVYAVLGHTIHFHNPWSIRFAGGITYARIDSDLKITAFRGTSSINLQQSNFTGLVVNSSTMSGWGPRAEFDASYNLGYNLALFANTNAALLVATREVGDDSYINDDFNGGADFSSRNVVVPKFGMRLGLSYTWMMGQAGAEGACGSSLTLAAGWQVDSYIHAIERPSDEEGNINSTKVSNYSDNGLFLGITFSSAWM